MTWNSLKRLFVKDMTQDYKFLFLSLNMGGGVTKKSVPGNFTYIWGFDLTRVGIIETKFEKKKRQSPLNGDVRDSKIQRHDSNENVA